MKNLGTQVTRSEYPSANEPRQHERHIGCAQPLADYSENIQFLGHAEESKRLATVPQLNRTSGATLFKRCGTNNVVDSTSGTGFGPAPVSI
jgi:hypothetical protein